MQVGKKVNSKLQNDIHKAMIEAQIFMDIGKSNDIIRESFQEDKKSFSVIENTKTKGSHKQPFYYNKRW